MPRRWLFVGAFAAALVCAACVSLSGLTGNGGEVDSSAPEGDAPGMVDTGILNRNADANDEPDTQPDAQAEAEAADATASDTQFEATVPTDSGSDVTGDEPSGCEDASTAPILPAQNNATVGGATATASVQLGQPLTAHDLLVVEVDFDQPNGSILGATDTDGNTFQTALGPYYSADGATYYILYAENVVTSASADTVTVTLTSAAQSYIEVYALEYRGIVTSGAFDVASANAGTSTATDGMQSGTRGTSARHELIFGFGSAGQAVAGTGFTTRNALDDNVAEDRVVNCIGSYETTATDTTGGTWTMLMATFRAY